MERSPFNGQSALKKENIEGSKWAIVGLDVNWPEIEKLYGKYGLPPEIGNHTWRDSIPLYTNNKNSQIGYATSGTWSPILKKNIALATIEKKYDKPGTEVQLEMTIEHVRHTVTAIVSKPQFYNPKRKTSNPNTKKS